MKKVCVAILGFGTVGGGVWELISANRDRIAATRGLEINIKKVFGRSAEKLIARGVPAAAACTDITEITSDPEISVVIEVMGGVEPAKTYIAAALEAGKSVVTANKELISKCWYQLEPIAKAHGAGLYFEASCVGGVPIIRTLNESMQSNRIESIMGIINGTTNYILTEMSESGESYGAALEKAKKLGYAETDPTADVEGYDAAYKLAILSSLAFHTSVPVSSVFREGISKVTADDVETGKKLGLTLKLLAIGRRDGNVVSTRVHPTFISSSHPLASVRGAFNAVFLEGDFVGELMLYGRGAGAKPTASAVVSDLIAAAESTTHRYADFENGGKVEKGVVQGGDFASKYYISILAADMPGVLAQMAYALGERGISIERAMQTGVGNDCASVIFLTHDTCESAMQSAMSALKDLESVREVRSLIRVI